MNAKGLLYFIGGAVFGGGLTFLLIKEKYKEESEEAIKEVKAYYKKLEEKDSGITMTVKADSVGAEGETKPSITTYTKLYSGESPAASPISIGIDEEDEEDEEDFSPLYPEEPASHPYVIDEAAFVNEKSFYDKLGLFYYSGDNTVVNENDEIVSDWENLIGPDIGARFRLQDRSDEPFNYIYIRNDQLGCDFEVALRKESFN